jgi:DNA repair exonuclease SbcCD ATPase subunit
VSAVDTLYDELQRAAGRRDQLAAQLASIEKELVALEQERLDVARAQEIIQSVAMLTQRELEVHVSELVTLALEAVFPVPYTFVLKFVTRRNKSEADLLLQDANGNLLSPMDDVGGGVVDVAALALRIALWSLKRPRPRAVMFLDEPLRFLSADLQDRASAMIKELSDKLGIQFLIVTHEENLLAAADRVFEVIQNSGVSSVSCVNKTGTPVASDGAGDGDASRTRPPTRRRIVRR